MPALWRGGKLDAGFCGYLVLEGRGDGGTLLLLRVFVEKFEEACSIDTDGRERGLRGRGWRFIITSRNISEDIVNSA